MYEMIMEIRSALVGPINSLWTMKVLNGGRYMALQDASLTALLFFKARLFMTSTNAEGALASVDYGDNYGF